MCVCVLMRTLCTITCFWFRATRINDINVVYFYSRTSSADHYMGNVYLYLCTERSEVRETVSVTVFVVCAVCGMMMKQREKVKLCAGI